MKRKPPHRIAPQPTSHGRNGAPAVAEGVEPTGGVATVDDWDHDRRETDDQPAHDVGDAMTEYELSLAERDQIITALTVQLEEAAERIDRLQRNGNERDGRRGGGGGVSAEFVEEQRQLAENVERFVLQWDESQPPAALARIEMQLEELRSLVVARVGDVGPGASDHGVATVSRDEPASSWQAMKERLLGGSLPNDLEPEDDAPVGEVGSRESDVADVAEPLDIESPEPVDFENADRDALCAAIERRDAQIALLTQRLQLAEVRRRKSDLLVAAEDSPEELKNRLDELEHIFQEQQRLAEVEMSLERARMAREEMRLKQLEERLHQESKRLGAKLSDDAGGDAGKDSAKHRRWKRILGLGGPREA